MIATSLLTACATGGSDPGGAVCPPVVTYDQALRERAAAELESLPEDAALVGIMADYAVMRAQARVCQAERTSAGRVLIRPARRGIDDVKKRQGVGMGRSWHGHRHLSRPEMGTIVHATRDRRFFMTIPRRRFRSNS